MRSIYFGTRGYERWVKMPKIDMDQPYMGHVTRNDQVNGGVSVIASDAGHREYSLAWGDRINEMRMIQSYLDGDFNNEANQGLLYFIDPSAATRNLFPKLWAAPYLCGLDAPSLTKGIRPALSDTPSNTRFLPARTATFTVGSTTPLLKFYVPLPPGYKAQFGFYGPSAQTSKIRVTPYSAGAAGSGVDYGIVANANYGSSLTTLTGADGIEFSLTPNAGSVSLTAAVLMVGPSTANLSAPTTYVAGAGHSGCRVDSAASMVVNNANERIDWANLTAHLVERGSWL